MAPNSPDLGLNLVDYAIWGALQERVYKGRKFDTVDQLKQAIVLEWRALPQRFIDHSISEWSLQTSSNIVRRGSEWRTQ